MRKPIEKSGLLTRMRSSVASFIAPSTGASSPLGSRSRAHDTAYESGSSSRRTLAWNPQRVGPTTSIYTSQDKMLSRARDQIRNNPWASSAIDNFEAQVISTGIRPRWNVKSKAQREKIEREFNKWAKSCDYYGQMSFWGLQALAAREVFESGEVFTRMYTRPADFNMRVPLQLQLLEAEQLPIFRNNPFGDGNSNPVRAGIEFDNYGRRVAYQFYNVHPYETMFYPMDGLQFMRVPASDVVHTYRPIRAGQLRGIPHLSSVLALLYELDQYTDAELSRKKIQAMWAAFVTKTSPDTDVIPIDSDHSDFVTGSPGTQISQLEPGTVNELLPGEDIKFPNLPADMDFESFMRVAGHRFAVGCGMTYEQLTGDLKGVNYSSIRAGLLDFRRKCELLQFNIFVHQFCQPIVCRWLKEAVLAGALDLPGYAQNPGKYEDILWTPSGWDWVDPLKDVQAEIAAIRAGLTTRSHSVAQRGRDVAVQDEEWVRDKERQDELGLVFDTDPSKILFKSKANPTDPVLLNADKDVNGDSSDGGSNGGSDGGGENGEEGGDQNQPSTSPRPSNRRAALYSMMP